MKTIRILLLCLSLTGFSSAANWVYLTDDDEPFRVEALSGDVDMTVLNYSVNRYSSEQVVIHGKEYTLLNKLRKESVIEENGSPRLPRINRSIIIPSDGVMGYEVISSDFIEITNIDIAPSKGNILRSVDPETVPYEFGPVYQKDEFFPGELVNIEKPYILRDFRGAVVQLNAFQYNPVKRILRIYTNVTIRIKKTSNGGENLLNRPSAAIKMDPEFYRIYKNHFVNFNQMDYPPLLESGEMMVICYDDFIDEMAPFVEWKTQKGIPTSIVALSEIGNDWRLIKDYIADAYNTTSLTYVLLVGDAAQLNTVPVDSGSDPVYSLTAGNDSYPDLFIGRLSAETPAQVVTQIGKFVEYEKYPQLGADWYHKGLGAATHQGEGCAHHGESDREHMTLIAYKLLDYTYTQVDSSYEPWGNRDINQACLNDGRGIFSYCGHGGPGGWGPPAYGSEDVNRLVNSNKLPYIINVACSTGDFVLNTCFAEVWLRATHDVTGEPTGAVSVYMSRTGMGWTPGMDMQDEAIDLLVADSIRTFGGLCFNGSGLMIDINGGGGIWEFKNLTIFGDPSLSIRTDTPFNINVAHNNQVTVGASGFDAVVTGPAGPLEGVYVCAMNDEVYASAITNSSGQVFLNFDNPPAQTGTLTLTVSGGNAVPYYDQIYIVQPSGAFVELDGFEVADDSTGNGNGRLDYDETVQLTVTLQNNGVAAAEDIIGILYSNDTAVEITDNTALFGDILVDSSICVNRAFQFEIDPGITDGDPVVFVLLATNGLNTWESTFSVISYAPNIIFHNLAIDDEASGNGNSYLESGETANLTVTLMNIGGADAQSVNAVLSSFDPYLTIVSSSTAFGNLLTGGTGEGVFTVTVSPDCPQDYITSFEIAIANSIGYNGNTGFEAVINDIICLPSGPDEYGYSAFDMLDAPLMPNYEWVEISRDSGGSGTRIPFVTLDQVFHTALPFNFSFYGQSDDSLTISDKGWIHMGILNQDYYNNTAIPDTSGPNGLIAAYWLDLVPHWGNSGGVWYWYDAVNHRYIVEYNNIPRYWQPDSCETFQIILLDPAHYPTVSGDGQIIFQYKDMSFSSQETGTIGIESPDETDGVEYRFNAVYHINAAPIGNGAAILFSTPVNAPDVLLTLTPRTPPIIIPASGGVFEYRMEIENTGLSPALFDCWTEVLFPDSSLHSPISLHHDMQLSPGGIYTFDLSQMVPGSAPGGEYIYRCNIGFYPVNAYSSDEFTFNKLGMDPNNDFRYWTLTGWDTDESPAYEIIPREFGLSQNYPNPFNPSTTFSYQLANSCNVRLTVYNVAGQEIMVLADGFQQAGNYQATFNGSDLSSGLYFVKLEAGDFIMTRKVLLIK